MCPQKMDELSMSASNVSIFQLEDQSAIWAGQLERIEQKRSGQTQPRARVSVARKIGIAPGTLENLKRGRSKGVRHWVHERIRNAVIHELEREIGRLNHELEMARQGGLRIDSSEIKKAFSALDAARELIRSSGKN